MILEEKTGEDDTDAPEPGMGAVAGYVQRANTAKNHPLAYNILYAGQRMHKCGVLRRPIAFGV